MTGDSYARFCEGPVVKFLRPTRRPYLGLVPKQEDSGESQPQWGISQAGDEMVRRLLVGSAHYILGPLGPDTDLRRYGLRLCERGGKNAKKRAAVAVARIGITEQTFPSAALETQFPAQHYVLIDDKLRILAAVKRIWGERVTTVFPKQGHYAHDPQALADYPAADIDLAGIADLMTYDPAAFMRKS